MEFKEGIYENLDYPTYDSIPAWRSHDLTSIAKCPFTWKNRTFNNSPALFEGRVMHTVFLEHYKFAEEFAIEPPVDRRTKVGKAEYAEWLEELGEGSSQAGSIRHLHGAPGGCERLHPQGQASR